MYTCPLCSQQYPGEVPANCVQCKRPLVLRGRFRIETSLGSGVCGEDFDAVDLKTKGYVTVRELRIKKAEAQARQRDIERYQQNRDRLRKMKFEGKPVVLDAFEDETANSRLLYLVFDSDAWSALGEELDGASGGAAQATDEPLEELDGRQMDPELEAMLAKINKERGGPPQVSKKDLGELGELDAGGGGGALAPKTKVVIGVSLIAIIGAIIAAVLLL